MSPFRNILKLSVGDFIAKAFYFAAFVRMAHVLGVANYGVLEFAVAIRTYLSLLADGGLEVWGVRESAKGGDIRRLVARVMPVRLLLAIVSCFALSAMVEVIPDNPNLKRILPLFGLTVLFQSVNLKWVFMGRDKMTHVAAGLMASQLVFSGLIFAIVRGPDDLIWVPLAWLAGEMVIVVYFWWLFALSYGGLRIPFTFRGMRDLLRPAFTLGASHGLGLMNYNLDSVLLGIFRGPGSVGWYAAAYKPVTVVLGAPISYFAGLFPALARAHTENPQRLRDMLNRSLRLTAIFAMPIGIGGALLAKPVILFLFGKSYLPSVPALQLLSWSAVLVILRGNFRQALNAVGRQRTDLLCAIIAVAINLTLELVLIPTYGILGAALATVLSEIAWFILASYCFSKFVVGVNLIQPLLRPVGAAAAMGGFLIAAEPLFWILRAALGVLLYMIALVLIGEPEVPARLPFCKHARVNQGVTEAPVAK